MISKITKGTVFLEGAEITRMITAQVQEGKNAIAFTGLTKSLNLESVTAEVSGNAQILTVTGHLVFGMAPEMDESVKELQEQLRVHEQQLEENMMHLDILKEEELFLQSNRKVGGERGACLEELKVMEEYQRGRFREIKKERLMLQKKQKELEEEKKQIVEQLGSYQDTKRSHSSEVIVELSAHEKGEVQVSISYFVYCAKWKPIYEIHVEDMEHPAILICKGEIHQETGEEWKEISLVLSSGIPTICGQKPKLQPWYLDVERKVKRKETLVLEEEQEEENLHDILTYTPEFLGKIEKIETRQTYTSVEFVVPDPVTVNALKDGQKIELTRYELSAAYQYYCVPKLDTDVFLLAKIKGWEALNLLEGHVDIFFQNAYVGYTNLDLEQVEDTLELSLGKVSNVIVTRVEGRDFSRRTWMGMNNKISKEWQITVKNSRQVSIPIKVLDQIPLSVSKSVTIEAVEISGAAYNEETGELCWERDLEAGASLQFKVKYSVTYPKKEYVVLE